MAISALAFGVHWGCSGSVKGLGIQDDGGPDPPDGQIEFDGNSQHDGALPPDGDGQPDAAVDPDSTSPPDAAVEPDSALPPDAAIEPDGGAPPTNRFGIGLVSPGNSAQWDLTANLTGAGGHIKLIFPGIDRNTSGAPQDWINAVTGCYDRDLIPVIRLGPHWGNRNVRSMADDASATSFDQLAQNYRNVVEDLVLRPGWPIYLEIHNEPNLCYEWECDPNNIPGGWIHYSQMAHEYAAYLRDVADALHAIGDSRIKVLNGALAPGGAQDCECSGPGYNPGPLATNFINEMASAVPNLWSRLDGWASHAYPAAHKGYDFWEPYANCMPGLLFFEDELAALGTSFDVFITETGWPTEHVECNGTCGTPQQIADWTVAAYNDPWLSNSNVRAVMPFILQDGAWDAFAWVDTSGNPRPVYTDVRNLRISLGL